jgi:hypothetical protein
MPEEFKPSEVIGQPYQSSLLPYGGGISMRTGRIVFATSLADHERIMSNLKALE